MVFVVLVSFAIIGGIAACLMPCIVNAVACFCMIMGLAEGGLQTGNSSRSLLKYSIALGSFVMVLLIAVILILIYVTEVETTEILIITLVVIPLCIAGITVSICLCHYGTEKFWDYRRKTNIEKTMNRQTTQQYVDILFLGNNTKTNNLLLTKLTMIINYNDECEYYKELLLKYLIKNMQSLIIQSNAQKQKNKKYFHVILSTPTYGVAGQCILEQNGKVGQYILNAWKDPIIQNMIHPENANNTLEQTNDNKKEEGNKMKKEKYQSLNINDINEYDDNINDIEANTEFLEHFLDDLDYINISSREDFESLILSEEDINILQCEHEYYQKLLYDGRNEIILNSLFKCILYDNKFGNTSKWLFPIYDSMKGLIYIMDLSIFKTFYQTNLNIINYWYSEYYKENYITFEIEKVLTSYLYSDYIEKDIEMFSKNIHFQTNEQILHCLLLVNYDEFKASINRYGVNLIHSFFPDCDIDINIDPENKNEIEQLSYQYLTNRYFASWKTNIGSNKLHFTINSMNDAERLKEFWTILKQTV